ncbi:tetraacyldisaccharide 4'-kinase [Thermocrinis albus DSM 14484]|uniref:Tetraacyldisaccharide 4'-kinase n=1 Tax=Thermocrinis albus (strain DSM 14484 / JCM 11386 / HI 11/12) TaxID=638303 RepID=D3SNH6_THEAH|nr:tetraacyldisaccharide 4'-kinase [Thermocrinis albus]ADC88713.1 tetraacyldisaccharide 4'-kinase [Thermocrinis albus DSM 14484]
MTLNPYAWVVNLRNYLYDKKLLPVCKPKVPVVSVGNLSVGGSGKTSVVRFLAESFSRHLHVVILSRGYRRKSKGTVVVSVRGDVKVSWEEAGDEAYMLAKVLPNTSVVVDEDRCRGAAIAVRELKADMLLLDDGFQHRRIHRDIDLLLLKREDVTDRVLPFGRLREPFDNYKRAHAVILAYQELGEWDLDLPAVRFNMVRENWKVLSTSGEVIDPSGYEFVAFCGLGDNNQFFRTLDILGIKTKARLSFPDHHHYRDLHLLKDQLYITTLKDAVKFPPYPNLFYLDFSVRVEGLIEWISRKLNIIINLRAGSSAGRATDS